MEINVNSSAKMEIDLNSSDNLIEAKKHVARLADQRTSQVGRLFHQLIYLNFKFTFQVTDVIKDPLGAIGFSSDIIKMLFPLQVSLVIASFIIAFIPLMLAALADLGVAIFSDRNDEKQQLMHEIADAYAQEHHDITNLKGDLRKTSEINHLFIKCYFLDDTQSSINQHRIKNPFGTYIVADNQKIDEAHAQGDTVSPLNFRISRNNAK